MPEDYTDFEARVADAFRALGADVRHNVDVGGHQVDVLVTERLRSGLVVVTAVECKHYGSNVGVRFVNDWAATLATLRRIGRVHKGAMVGEVGFSRPAIRAAAEEGIDLVLLADLEARPEPDVLAVSSAAREAVRQAGIVQALLREALSTVEGLTAFDWEDLHASVAKALALMRDAGDLYRPAAAEAAPTRRARAAVARVEEDAERCLDAVWYLRSVTRLGEDWDAPALPGSAGETDRASAALVRLRETDQARGQLRARLRRLAETCRRLGALGG